MLIYKWIIVHINWKCYTFKAVRLNNAYRVVYYTHTGGHTVRTVYPAPWQQANRACIWHLSLTFSQASLGTANFTAGHAKRPHTHTGLSWYSPLLIRIYTVWRYMVHSDIQGWQGMRFCGILMDTPCLQFFSESLFDLWPGNQPTLYFSRDSNQTFV